MNNKDMITSKQLIFAIIGTQLGTGVFSLPRIASAIAGQDAWISVILGAVIPFTILLIIERLGRRMLETGFVGMNQLLFGRWLGSCVVFLFIVYTVVFQAVVLRSFSETTNLFLLPRTPLSVVILLPILAVGYAINKGVQVVVRLSELIFWILLPLLFLVMMTLKNGDYTNLLPVGEAGLTGIAQGALTSSYSYQGIEVLLVFYFFVGRKDEVIKAGIIGLASSTITYLTVTLVCLLVWGSELMQLINWPELTVLKTMEFPVLERPEFLTLATWMGLGIRPIMNMGFAAAYSLSEILHIDRSKYFHLVVLFLAMMVYIIALIPSDIIMVFKWADYAGYSFLLVGLLYPLTMLLIAIIRGKVKKNA